MRGRLSMAVGRSTFGAERRHVTLPTDFRSRSENGHSRYGHLTARFAPERKSGCDAAGFRFAPLSDRDQTAGIASIRSFHFLLEIGIAPQGETRRKP